MKTVCDGVIGIKCARCKAKHSRRSLYEDTPEGCACARALIAEEVPVEDQAPVPATPPAIKADPLSKRATRPRKKVRIDAPPLSPCISHANEAVSTAALTSRLSSPDPSINFALIIRSMLVAAIDAPDKSLEEQGISKVLDPSFPILELQQLQEYICALPLHFPVNIEYILSP
ncbi:hypothetical protein EDD17DRAFT_1749454 [Pisolithus thermaeus]|nr:hypothetical protein EDD17DRAFT_1749454 [Pisolithus thermaeus]